MQSPLWKRILIWGICALGLLYAIPNLFYSRVETHNDAAKAIAAAGVATPEQEAALAAWPGWMPSRLMNLGLDLRGGAHLLAHLVPPYAPAGGSFQTMKRGGPRARHHRLRRGIERAVLHVYMRFGRRVPHLVIPSPPG